MGQAQDLAGLFVQHIAVQVFGPQQANTAGQHLPDFIAFSQSYFGSL
jgi:hypothetical protein